MAECGCGRSPTGKCVGWHGLSDEQYQDQTGCKIRTDLNSWVAFAAHFFAGNVGRYLYIDP
ncbi:MAG: hypothetical protein EBW61_13090 [Rhodobacteraceae bacterium]|nr:hypothetical protein [Paracoccaceae bacterium]